MNEIKEVNIEDLQRMNGEEKAEYLRLRHEWLKKVRKQDKRVYKAQESRIYHFLHRDELREKDRERYKCSKLQNTKSLE